jgi:hypothetical protein
MKMKTKVWTFKYGGRTFDVFGDNYAQALKRACELCSIATELPTLIGHTPPIEKHFVWCPTKTQPVVAHNTKQSAIDEAKRLARLQPGYTTFHVLKLVGSAKSEPVKVTYDSY